MSRLSILFASLIAGAMGLPSNLLAENARGLSNRQIVHTVYDVDVVWVTETVYETEGTPSTATKADEEGPWKFPFHHHHHPTKPVSIPVPSITVSATTQPVQSTTQVPVPVSSPAEPTQEPSSTAQPSQQPSSTVQPSPEPASTTPANTSPAESGGNQNVPTACSTGSTWPASWNIPTPTADTNVDAHYGGADFPFMVTQDQAPSFSGTDYVDLHNQYRALHGAAPMTKNQTLEDVITQNMANGNCPNGDTIAGYGGSNWFGSSSTADGVSEALGAWYSERSNYTANSDDYLCNSFSSSATLSDGTGISMQETGHFTQMVWNSSVTVGCAMSTSCSSGMQMQYLCLYYPAGNVEASWYPGNLLNVYRPSQ